MFSGTVEKFRKANYRLHHPLLYKTISTTVRLTTATKKTVRELQPQIWLLWHLKFDTETNQLWYL